MRPGGVTYRGLATQRPKSLAQQKRLLEAAARLSLGRTRVRAAINLAVVAVADLLGALLPGGLLLLLGHLCPVAAPARRAGTRQAVLLGLQLRGQAGVCILERR